MTLKSYLIKNGGIVMERLVVMDFSDSSVTVYSNPDESKDTETLLMEYGHNPNECSVMFCESVTINLK